MKEAVCAGRVRSHDQRGRERVRTGREAQPSGAPALDREPGAIEDAAGAILYAAENATKVALDAPADLRDMVWMPAHLLFDNGGESVALIPTRYPGSHTATDGSIALARRTEWREIARDTYYGLGQRIIATDGGDTPLLDIRTITVRADGGEIAGVLGEDHA